VQCRSLSLTLNSYSLRDIEPLFPGPARKSDHYIMVKILRAIFHLFLAFLNFSKLLISYKKIFQNAEIFLIFSLSEFSFFFLPEISYIDISDLSTFKMKKKDQSCSLQLLMDRFIPN
jgi:hypothetical protein